MKKNIYYFNSCFCHVVLYGFIASTEFTSPIIWFLGAIILLLLTTINEYKILDILNE